LRENVFAQLEAASLILCDNATPQHAPWLGGSRGGTGFSKAGAHMPVHLFRLSKGNSLISLRIYDRTSRYPCHLVVQFAQEDFILGKITHEALKPPVLLVNHGCMHYMYT
jgi:hypothetical protein